MSELLGSFGTMHGYASCSCTLHNDVAVQRVEYKTAREGRYMELWHMGNMNTGKMDAVLEPK